MIKLNLQRLEETAEMGRALIRRLPGAGLVIVDAALRILVADGDAHRYLDQDTVVGRRVPDVIPAGAWEILEHRFLVALDGHVQSFEYESVEDGSVHSIRLAPIHHDTGVIGVMGLSQDITAKAAATLRLAESERSHRSVLEALDEGVIVLDLDGRLAEANGAACGILGLDLVPARADPSWWLPFGARRADGGSPLDIGATVLETGRGVRDVEVEIDRPDGTTALVSLNYQPLHDSARAVSGLVLSFRDVTERQRERRHLVEMQERLREAHEVARLASWEWQPETDEVLVFQGLEGDEALTGTRARVEDLFATIPPAIQKIAREDLTSMVRGESDQSVRRYCQPGLARPVWLELRCRAVRDGDERLLCVRGTSQNVTEQELAKQAAARSRDFFQATLDSLPAHVAVLDEKGEIVMINRAWVEFAAVNDARPSGLDANYLEACDAAVSDEWAARAGAGLRAILAGGQDEFSMQYPCHGPSEERWFVMRAARFEGPGPARVVIAHDDVTKHHQAEAEVAMQAALLHEVDAAVVATDRGGGITHWNSGAERLYGWTYAEVLGRNVGKLVTPPEADYGDEVMSELRRSGKWEGEVTLCRKDGSTFSAYVRDKVITNDDGRPVGMIAVSVDMTERVASERALRAGRNYLQAVADSMGEGLFTLDVEGRVTYMNDAAQKQLGWSLAELEGRVLHPIAHHRRADGSDLPIEECCILRARRDGETLRIEDDIFIRRDGSELPVVYTAAPFETDDGVEGCVVVFEDVSERRAEEESLRQEADKLMWIGRIQDALVEDRFVLYAQPIVAVSSGEVVQRELLLRLREPSGAIVGPGAYLPIAEQYGLIGDIDRWVIERGAEIAATGCPVEVNLSARSVGDPDVSDHIERCIRHRGVDAALMVFEITETAIVEDEAAARVFAERLRDLGCKLALDDFGTGYGGFTYLKQIPVDYLKIDIEFVRDLTTSPASHHVVEAVVALARGFDLETVAEGVEDAETFELLRELGVDLAQGYHIARPGPIDQGVAT